MTLDDYYSANVVPLVEHDYGPYRCTCAWGYKCAACKAYVPEDLPEDLNFLHFTGSGLRVTGSGLRVEHPHTLPMEERRRQAITYLATCINYYGRLPLSHELRAEGRPPGSSYWNILKAYDSMTDWYQAGIDAGLCNKRDYHEALVRHEAHVTAARRTAGQKSKSPRTKRTKQADNVS